MPDDTSPRKKKVQWEARYASEFVLTFYPDARAWFNKPIGTLPARILDQDLTPSELATLSPLRPRIDALVVQNAELLAIECWIIPELGKAGQLRAYLRVIADTPELGEYAKLPLRPILVGPFTHALMRAEALDFGIASVVYRPSWIEQATASRSGSKARDNFRGP